MNDTPKRQIVRTASLGLLAALLSAVRVPSTTSSGARSDNQLVASAVTREASSPTTDLHAQSPSSTTASAGSNAAAHGSVRVVIDSAVDSPADWYDDQYGHADGDHVDWGVTSSDDRRTMDLSISSRGLPKTSGVRLQIHLSTNEHGEPVASVVGHWHLDVDRGNLSSHGDLDDFRGEIYLSSSYFVRSRALSIKFHLEMTVRNATTVLMGGLRVKD